MSTSWYYVESGERRGPVDELTLVDKITAGELGAQDYVWSKGFENWEKIESVGELASHLSAGPAEETAPGAGSIPERKTDEIDLLNVDMDKKMFTIKIGVDRGSRPVEYGPYSLETLKTLFDENRINGKTLVFAAGLESWMFLSELKGFEQIFNAVPPVIEESERRKAERRPFVARMLFHDQSEVYEGACRDISVGGMQILVSDFPGKVGEEISMNVHPENSDYCFVASGKIVRFLEGNQGFSFRFTDLADDAKTAIERYVVEHE